MSNQNKLYKCYKEGCYFRQDHPDGPFLTQIEYEEHVKDGNVNCPEGNLNCGLQELKPEDYPKHKKDSLNIKLLSAIALSILVIGALVFYITSGNSSEELEVAQTEVRVDPIPEPEVIEELVEEVPAAVNPEPIKVTEPVPVKPQPSVNSSAAPKGTQTLNLSGNLKYTGEVMNGRPHGLGTMYYIQQTLISPKDLKKRMAEGGDYITGEFYEGKLVQGKLFDRNNELKEVLTIGR
jgi:hypothetical protein